MDINNIIIDKPEVKSFYFRDTKFSLKLNHKDTDDVFGTVSHITYDDEFIRADLKIYTHYFIKRGMDSKDEVSEYMDSLTPAIEGIVKYKDGDKIKELEVIGVSLNSSPNVNPEVKTIGEQRRG